MYTELYSSKRKLAPAPVFTSQLVLFSYFENYFFWLEEKSSLDPFIKIFPLSLSLSLSLSLCLPLSSSLFLSLSHKKWNESSNWKTSSSYFLTATRSNYCNKNCPPHSRETRWQCTNVRARVMAQWSLPVWPDVGLKKVAQILSKVA